ncbi:MAG: alpha/beta fold hydrolase [Chloroflexota bacterium]
MNYKKLIFPNSQGELLGARLDLPVDSEPIAYALFAHCFTCTKNIRAAGNISRALTQHSIGVLRFDFTGLGESEGDFANTNFTSNVDDLVAAADYLEREYEAPKILVGHSLGGAAVLQAASRLPKVAAVATVAAPYDPGHVTHLLQSAKEEIENEGEAEVLLAGRPFRIKKQFLDDLESTQSEQCIRNLKKALLVLHGPLDQTVGIENAANIFQAAKHPKSFITLDEADHLLSNEADSLYAGAMIGAWANKYIGVTQEEEKAPKVNPLGESESQVIVRTEDGFYTEVLASGHSLVADEPVSLGGTNQGPTPYDYMLAGLGSCTTITLRMYADRKGWPLESVVVHLNHNKIHAQDCEACETEKGKIDHVERILELNGPLTTEQIQRLVEIADKCPVHKTLHSEIHVETQLKISG